MTEMNKTDILLLRYAAGSLNRGGSLAVLILMIIHEDTRRKVEGFEAIGGQLIQEESPADVSPACLEIVLKRIETPVPPTLLERFLILISKS